MKEHFDQVTKEAKSFYLNTEGFSFFKWKFLNVIT